MAKPRDNATTTCRACAVSGVEVFDSLRRDQRLQGAVYCRTDKDFAAEMICAQVRTRCIQDVSETLEKRNVAHTSYLWFR